MNKKPCAFDYLCTQDFVRAIDRWATKEFSGYSRRTFARWAGVRSPNFMSLVIEGKRPLKGLWLTGFGKAAKLSKEEIEHLNLLSQFESARTPQSREAILETIRTRLANRGAKSLALDQLEILTNSLAWTVLQMLDLKDLDPAPLWFKQRLRSSISASAVASALSLLKRLGLIQIEKGQIRPAQRILKSPDQVQKASNALFHKNVLKEAEDMLELVDPKERAYGSLTATVAREKLEAIKREANSFGQYLLDTYASHDVVDGEVIRFNIQLYPLTFKSELKDE